MHGEQAVVPMFTDLINFNSVTSAQYKSVFLDHYYFVEKQKSC